MIILSLIIYAAVAGVILMDRGHELDEVRRLIKKKLSPLGVEVDVTLKANGTVVYNATKTNGLSVQHATVESVGLLEGILALIEYIEENILQWIEKEYYG